MSPYQISNKIELTDFPTSEIVEKGTKKLKKLNKQLSKLQDAMYAEGKYAVLICLQGMDTSGKDSLIREVFKEVNAQGIEVHSFKVPSELEKQHDYLWRHYIALPERGKIGIFNRTHYENVLVTRVHPEYMIGENIPSLKSVEDADEAFFDNRMEEINNFEKHVSNNGTIILKFFLHLSKDEQKARLLRRLRLKDKNWKFEPGDLKERKLWDEYQWCYQELLNKTSTDFAPWHIVPADDKISSRVIVAQTIVDKLKEFDFKEPQLPQKYKVEIGNYKKQLETE